jgi:hypothetical protein
MVTLPKGLLKETNGLRNLKEFQIVLQQQAHIRKMSSSWMRVNSKFEVLHLQQSGLTLWVDPAM